MTGSKTVSAQREQRAHAVALAVACCFALIPAAAAQPSLLDKGRDALETRCSRCHAIGFEDESRHAQAPPFRDVMKRYPPEDLEESLAEGIVSGHPDMPEYVLAPDEIEAVIAYLHGLSGL